MTELDTTAVAAPAVGPVGSPTATPEPATVPSATTPAVARAAERLAALDDADLTDVVAGLSAVHEALAEALGALDGA